MTTVKGMRFYHLLLSLFSAVSLFLCLGVIQSFHSMGLLHDFNSLSLSSIAIFLSL